jgi:hypothetical protein
VVTRFTLVVPVTGDPSLFGMRTGIFSPELAAGPIAGEIDHPSRVLRLHCDNPADADHAKAYFEWALDPSEQQNAYVPEPAIDEGNYEAVLAVLRNAGNALERSPSMSAKLDEEETRDLLPPSAATPTTRGQARSAPRNDTTSSCTPTGRHRPGNPPRLPAVPDSRQERIEDEGSLGEALRIQAIRLCILGCPVDGQYPPQRQAEIQDHPERVRDSAPPSACFLCPLQNWRARFMSHWTQKSLMARDFLQTVGVGRPR